MGYYKLIKEIKNSPFILNKIYYLEDDTWHLNKYLAEYYPEWKSVEEWEYYQQEGLPEKWCILQNSSQEVCDWFSKIYATNNAALNGNFKYLCYDSKSKESRYWDDLHGYTEISLKTFEKLILNKQENMEKDKEIIGWNLKENCYKYAEAAFKLVGFSGEFSIHGNIIKKNIRHSSSAANKLKEAGVLELWFEPCYKEDEYKVGDWVLVKYTGEHVMGFSGEGERVLQISYFKDKSYYWPQKGQEKENGAHMYYIGFNDNTITFSADTSIRYIVRKATPEEITEASKPKFPQITINSYKGEFLEDRVKFGCASISKDTFIGLSKLLGGNPGSNKTIMKVTIGQGEFTKEQIKEIAQYYLNK